MQAKTACEATFPQLVPGLILEFSEYETQHIVNEYEYPDMQ